MTAAILLERARCWVRSVALWVVTRIGWLFGFCLRALVHGICKGWDAASKITGELF